MFPRLNVSYDHLSKEEYIELLYSGQGLMTLGMNDCFSVIHNIQLTYTGEAQLDDAMIGPMDLTNDNLINWNMQFNDNLASLGYYNITELLLDRGFEKVETPQLMDIAWVQANLDFKTLRPNEPFDRKYLNNGYIYNGEKWLKKDLRRWVVVDDAQVEAITSNGIFRMVSS